MKVLIFALFLFAIVLVGCSQFDNPLGPVDSNSSGKTHQALTVISPLHGDTVTNPVHFSWTKYPGAAYYVFHWSQVRQFVDEDRGATMRIWDADSTTTGDTVFVNIRGFGRGTTHYWRVYAYTAEGVNIDHTPTHKWYIRM